jgi:hypothetical protein
MGPLRHITSFENSFKSSNLTAGVCPALSSDAFDASAIIFLYHSPDFARRTSL